MKKYFLLAAIVLVFIPNITIAGPMDGIPGATNKNRAATLIVPFFEVGINQTEDPLDTLLAVSGVTGEIIHYHVWDIDGNATELNGNIDMGLFDTWSASMKSLISAASSSIKTQLTDGDYYRGFVTIDVVTESTSMNPTQSSYPFGNANDIFGFIYYVRLLQGSANGIDMIPIEYVGHSVDVNLRDFYQQSSGREEIDAYAKFCISNLAQGDDCSFDPGSINLDIYSRLFLNPDLSAGSRIIVFSWLPQIIGGPTVYCGVNGCPTSYIYWQLNESGNIITNTSIPLNHVVNVIDVSGTVNGWAYIANVPGVFQTFAFSFNSASSSTISTNWDAIFESYLVPND